MAETKGGANQDRSPPPKERKVAGTTKLATEPIAVKRGETVRIVIPRKPIFSG
ncbi:hypothetical protein [Anaeromyxobacter oryzisoli]|uniref:hypothetical protein n=1 Tax=Anaeromyxobacter oryzisoli TaxID=2925408 RepID=UPI001F595613|nr:hypothetical protein [Anaeromyxobacter sp. SG63]